MASTVSTKIAQKVVDPFESQLLDTELKRFGKMVDSLDSSLSAKQQAVNTDEVLSFTLSSDFSEPQTLRRVISELCYGINQMSKDDYPARTLPYLSSTVQTAACLIKEIDSGKGERSEHFTHMLHEFQNNFATINRSLGLLFIASMYEEIDDYVLKMKAVSRKNSVYNKEPWHELFLTYGTRRDAVSNLTEALIAHRMFSVITDEITGLTDEELDDYAGFVIQWRLKMAGFVLPHEPKFDPEILLDLTKE